MQVRKSLRDEGSSLVPPATPLVRRVEPSRRVRIRVHYPTAAGTTLVLRSAADWDCDIEPRTMHPDGADFDLPAAAAPFVYFKVLLRRDGALHWSKGENLLAFSNSGPAAEVYPFFFADPACSVCQPLAIPGHHTSRQHTVRVFLPPGYAENTAARYPVLYMQDGQNLFFPDEAFGGQHWKIDETLGILDRMNLIRPAIVVGVYPRDRSVDYTQPGYEEYGRFLVEDLKPWIDSHYRTETTADHTAVLGSSLGGVVSLYLGWQYPEVFGHVGCLSSTFSYQDDLRRRIATESKRPIRIYLDSGWPHDNYEVTRAMHTLLVARGYRPGTELLYLAFPRAQHDENAWAMRAHIPFQHFFAP